MVINYDKFKFLRQNIEIKKILLFKVWIKFRLRVRVRVRGRIRGSFRVRLRVKFRVRFRVRFRVLNIIPIFTLVILFSFS